MALEQAIEILRATRDEHLAELARAVQARPAESNSLRLGLTPGTVVVDLITGQEGVILAGTITHALIPPARGAGR